jgi:predicted kinase
MVGATGILAGGDNFLLTPKAVVLLRGIPGAGKTTVARWIKRVQAKSTIWSADDHFVVNGVYLFNGAQLGTAHRSCQLGFSTWAMMAVRGIGVVDNTNIALKDLRVYLNMAAMHNLPTEIWSIQPPPDLARSVHNVPQKTMERLLNAFTTSEQEVSKLAGYRCITQNDVNSMYQDQK